MNNSKKFDSAYYQEWAFIQGRKFLLSILALGSVLITHKIGSYISLLIVPNFRVLQFLITSFFIFLGYMGIDWVLANALSSASNIQEGKKSKSDRTIWIFAFSALSTTILLSFVSNFFISSELAGEAPFNQFHQQIEKSRLQDSIMKVNAYELINKASDEQVDLIKRAKKEKQNLLAKAVQKGSKTWKKDYYQFKDNDKAWFWTCSKCPREYRQYRDNIKQAMIDGDELITKAMNHQNYVQTNLSPTLSYQLSKDTMLLAIKDNTQKLEEERQSRKWQLNIILFAMTLGAGILALILTYVIKKHREEHGQQVNENNALLLMIFFDMVSRFFYAFADILYTLIAQPFNSFKKRGWIKSYTFTADRKKVVTDDEDETNDNRDTKATANRSNGSVVGVQRNCLKCNTDISHKRSDAKFCSDDCRMIYHNYVPRKKQNGLLHK